MVTLPTGTVAFLYTDIEGSTALWQRHADAMPAVIARHDTLLRELVRAHRGVVFRTVGDAVHAAFVAADDAVAAALAAQRALAAEPWAEGIALRVRMAVHTGAADVRDGEYVGHTLNRVARLVASGHGGQILLSGATAELVRQTLPAGTALRDLGEHRLKDLVLPEHIYAVEVPDLPAEFPPLRTLDQPRTNLPVQRGALLGRERELAAVAALLVRDDVGLVTFTGPGGSGKTRLAIAAARALLDHFAGGVWFVPLAPITDPALVPPAVAAAVGLREEGGRTPLALLQDFVRSRQLLLVLDNFEQVVDAAPLVGQLLEGAARLKVLVTSRTALRLREERELAIGPLGLPDPARTRDLASLAQAAAVQLFVARAREVKPDFAVTEENAPAVAEICARLDGLPLAIELAAARVRVLTPQALLGRLQRRLPLLTGGAPDLPARQRTMQAAIAWSYDLLTEAERTLYGRLAVFAGGFTLEAAEAVCDPEGLQLDLLDGVTSLVDKSLVRQEEVAAEPRFAMLHTIREYGLERLEERGEAEAMRRRHAQFFTELAEQLERALLCNGPASVYRSWDVERDNFRAALDWSQGELGDTELGLRLVAALLGHWVFGGLLTEGRTRAEAIVARADAARYPAAWAGALITVGALEEARGGHAQARARLHQSVQILRGTGDSARLSQALTWLGITAIGPGDIEAAVRCFTEGREFARAAGTPWAEATALSFIPETMAIHGNLAEVRAMAEEALGHYRALHDAWGRARMDTVLAGIAWREGDLAAAHRLCAEAVELLRGVGERWNLGYALTRLGLILLDEAQHAEAEATLIESLLAWRDLGNDDGTILTLAGLAAAAAAQGQTERARRLYAAEPLHRPPSGALLDSLSALEFEHVMARLRGQLGDRPQGDHPLIALEEAVGYALEQPSTAIS